MEEYANTLESTKPFAQQLSEITEEVKAKKLEAKKKVDSSFLKKEKKKVRAEFEEKIQALEEKLIVAKEAC